MNHKTFLASHALVYALRSFFDSIHIFFMATLVCMFSMGAFVAGAVMVNLAFIKQFIEIIKKLRIAQTMDIPADMADQVKAMITLFWECKIALGVTGLLLWFVISALAMGYVFLFLEYYDTGTSSITRLFSGFGRAPLFMIATVIVTVVYMIGFALFIVPGIYMVLRLILFPYVMVDRGVGPLDALKESWYSTQGNAWMIFGVVVAHVLLCSISLWTVWLVSPVIGLSFVYVYRVLTPRKS